MDELARPSWRVFFNLPACGTATAQCSEKLTNIVGSTCAHMRPGILAAWHRCILDLVHLCLQFTVVHLLVDVLVHSISVTYAPGTAPNAPSTCCFNVARGHNCIVGEVPKTACRLDPRGTTPPSAARSRPFSPSLVPSASRTSCSFIQALLDDRSLW